MNGGLHGAIGLAWRMAMTLAGAGGGVLLDSWAVERHGEQVRLGEQQVKGFGRLMYRSRLQDAALRAVALRAVAGSVPNLGGRLFGADDLQQLAISYPDSPLTEDHPPARAGTRRHAPGAGERAPDARVAGDDGTTTSLIDEFANPDGHTWGWTLLGFDGGKRDAADDLARAIAATAGQPWVHPRLVLAHPEAEAKEARRLFDLDQGAHAAYGMRGLPALVLVRPDGHVAFRAPLHQAERLARFCAGVAEDPRPA